MFGVSTHSQDHSNANPLLRMHGLVPRVSQERKFQTDRWHLERDLLLQASHSERE
jgi:hypothetical protein